MARVPAYSKHKFLWLILISVTILALLGLTCCSGGLRILFPVETRAPEEFPEADIVFIADNSVGFVNADGSGAVYVPLTIRAYGSVSDFWRPVITGDRRTLIIKVMDSRSFVFNPHYLAVWRTGELPALCTQWGYQQMPLLATDQAYIFVSAEQGLALYDVSSCGTDVTPTKVYENVFGVPSPDLQYAAYTNRPSPDPDDDRFIAIQNIVSGEVKIVGIGEYPVWSRDSHWLAYIGLDGIYVANVAEGTRPRRVVLYPNLFNNGAPTYAGRSYWDIPPEVSWSPDGKWLIYHKWTGTNYYTGINPSDNAIYKLNIETGEETKIIDGGMYPYWRWPVQQ